MLGPLASPAMRSGAAAKRRPAARTVVLWLTVLAVGVTAVADAAGRRGRRVMGATLGLDFGVTSFDEDAARRPGLRLAGRVGWQLSDRFELELQYSDAENEDVDDHARLWTTFLNLLVNFRADESTSPYLLFGLGRAKLEVGGRDEAATASQIGAGSRFALTDDERLAGRVEASLQRESALDLGTSRHVSLSGGISFRAGRLPQPGAIEGTVTAAEGVPIAGVGASLTRAGSQAGAVVTDSEGLFRFEELEAGGYEVILDRATLPADHWIAPEAATAAVEVLAGETAALAFEAAAREEVALSAAESAGTISGRVAVDADGDGEARPGETPLGGVEVLLSRAGARIDSRRSGADGHFAFGRQAPGSYEARISGAGLAERYRLGEGARASVVVPFEVGLRVAESWGEVTGAVRVDQDGDGTIEEGERGLGGVGIEIASEGSRVGGAESGDDGTFGLGRQGPGLYLVSILEASLPGGYRTREGRSAVEIRVPYSLGLLAQPAGEDVVGRVWVDSDDDGRRGRGEGPLAGVGIDLAVGGRSLGAAATDAAGGFRLGSEGPGRYAVSIVESSVPSGYRVGRGMSPRYVTVVERVAAGMSVAEGDGILAGEVWADRDENRQRGADEAPIAGVELTLSREEAAEAEEPLAVVRTGGDGAFDLGPREPGRYRVDLVAATLPAGYFVGPGVSPQFVEVPEQLGSIAVSVWADENLDGQAQRGEPGIGGVEIRLRRGDKLLATGRTDARGGFVFAELEPGQYEVRVVPDAEDRRFWVGSGVLPQRIALGPGEEAVAAFPIGVQQLPPINWILWLLLLLLAIYALIHLLLRKRRFGRVLAPCWLPWPPADRRKSAALLRELRELKKPGARKTLEKLDSIRGRLGKLTCARAEVATELFLSYRGVRGWSRMYEIVEEMAPALAATPLVLQQKAFALNRDGRGEEAEEILIELREKHGPSPETNGILGRVYKDRWEASSFSETQLRRALETYLEGHRSDPSDPYPGVNALTLLESFAEPPADRERLLQEVRRAVDARRAKSEPDYWDAATRLEFAVLTGDAREAWAALEAALAAPHDVWQPETTLRNLRLIQAARGRHGREVPSWLGDLAARLEAAVGRG